jgi:hypothetical protein
VSSLQGEDLFNSEGSSTQLDGLVIEQNSAFASEQRLSSPRQQRGSAGGSDAEQFTINTPHLLDRPVPAKPNPMARLIESSETPYHITSHHITSHHITSHHITSHHITSHQARHLGYPLPEQQDSPPKQQQA